MSEKKDLVRRSSAITRERKRIIRAILYEITILVQRACIRTKELVQRSLYKNQRACTKEGT